MDKLDLFRKNDFLQKYKTIIEQHVHIALSTQDNIKKSY